MTPASPTQDSAHVRGRLVAALPNIEISIRIRAPSPSKPSTTSKMFFAIVFFILSFSFAFADGLMIARGETGLNDAECLKARVSWNVTHLVPSRKQPAGS